VRSSLLALDFAAIVTSSIPSVVRSRRGENNSQTLCCAKGADRGGARSRVSAPHGARPESAPGGFGTVVPVAGTTVVEGIRRRVGRARPPREPGPGPDLGRSATTGLGDR